MYNYIKVDMNGYLILILLIPWSLLITHSEECDTGVAFTSSKFSAYRSTLAKADAAFLKSYAAQSVEKCMEDCCSGTYGACSIVSYVKNTTSSNCIHYYCQPIKQCKFLSSNSTDSFTFSSGSHASHNVPSNQTFSTSTTKPLAITPKAKLQIDQPRVLEEIATFSEEAAGLKNDNTSVKPRKGVIVLTPAFKISKSGIKPRKGVTLEDLPHSQYFLTSLNKSNVKPRKGVETYSSSEVSNNENKISKSSFPNTMNDSVYTKYNLSDENTANELVSELQRLFEDDDATNIESSMISETISRHHISSPTTLVALYSTRSIERQITSETDASVSTNFASVSGHLIEPSFTSTNYFIKSSPASSLAATPEVEEGYSRSPSTVPLLSANAHFSMEEPKAVDKSSVINSEEEEKTKKYQSSIHLVLSLVFGLLVLFVVLGIVAKRMYDGYQRRDYHRMNYLIDGIYNSY